MQLYRQIDDAIRAGNAQDEPTCIGWDKVEFGWRVYPTEEGAPENLEPEFFCLGPGFWPFPLSPEALDVLNGLIAAKQRMVGRFRNG